MSATTVFGSTRRVMLVTSFAALGTTARVAVADPGAVARAREVVAAEIDALDRACSRFRPDSELAALNNAHGEAVPVDPLLLAAIDAAMRAAELTDGLVDPTVGRIMEALGYDRDFAEIEPDGPLQLGAPIEQRWRAVEIDRRARTVRVPSGVHLDLGATAKALGADRAAAAAAAETGCGVLVSLGGDVAVSGEAPGTGWPVTLGDDSQADPDGTAGGQTVLVRAGGLATSSTTVRRWRRGGQVVHHIVDPRSGRPASGPWRTVTVAAASCVEANTATTASIVLGAPAPQWLERNGLPARLVAVGGLVTRVGGWPEGDTA